MMSPFLGELIGTAILILLGNGVVANVVLKGTKGEGAGWIVIAWGWGMAVFVAVFTVAAFSGAHINPAVSVALAVAGKFPWASVPMYVIAQFLGAMIGTTLVWAMYYDHFGQTENQDLKLAVFCTGPAIRNTQAAPACDMVVGARTKLDNVPWTRRPAKAALTWLASYLAEQPIPDLNSGVRVLRKSLVGRFTHILPSGFSFTTTITLAMLCNGYHVRFEPIEYRKRIGQSKIRPRNALQFLILIIRTATLFNPLRLFLPLGGVPFGIGGAKLAYDLSGWNVSDGAIMGLLAGLIIWSVGVLADLTSRTLLGLGR